MMRITLRYPPWYRRPDGTFIATRQLYPLEFFSYEELAVAGGGISFDDAEPYRLDSGPNTIGDPE